MVIQCHKPHGSPENQQHPLPANWKDIASKASNRPARFGVVDPDKLYRSGMIWPHHVNTLQEDYQIKHIISLLDGDWLKEFYNDNSIIIHQFPFYQRKELTFDRVKNIVDVINSLKEPAIVHCFKGATRTGMVCAGYHIINGKKGNLAVIIGNMKYMDFNISSMREILHYSDKF